MVVNLKNLTPDAEKNIVEIARVSSQTVTTDDNMDKLINYLIKNHHMSPFEHSYLTFEIKTSKSIGIQLIRHRSFSFQEFSQRYSKVENFENIELRQQAVINRQSSTDVFDPEITLDTYFGGYYPSTNKASMLINGCLEEIKMFYNKLLDAGVAKECARMILPMCTETTIYMTGNIRSWLTFLNLRLDNHCQKEMVDIARKIADIIAIECPIITKATNNFNNYQGMFM